MFPATYVCGTKPAISTSLNFWKTSSSAAPCGMYRWLPTRARLRMSAAYTVISSKIAIRRESTALARPHTIASYAAAKEVPCARVVFCDAKAYDAGWLAPEDIAGRVEVRGRGGTILQPGVDLLLKAKDFPKDAPILIIADGYIEKNLSVHREHGFHIPRGNHLPFRAKGKVFYFAE